MFAHSRLITTSPTELNTVEQRFCCQKEVDEITITSTSSSSSSSTTTHHHRRRRGKNDSSNIRKRVSFDLNQNKYYSSDNGLWQEDLKVFWYKHTEIRHFRLQTYSLARQCLEQMRRMNNNSYARLTERAYCTFSNSPLSSSTDDDHRNAIDCLLGHTHVQKMAHWIDIAPCLVGLERFMIRRLINEKLDQRNELTIVVLSVRNISQETPNIKNEITRRSCERITRPMVLLARCLAEIQNPDLAK